MAKTKISEFDSNPVNNTDIDGINLAEGMAPGLVNNAIRELMAQLKDFQAGIASDNVTVGGNLAVTGTSALTGNVTITGTATMSGRNVDAFPSGTKMLFQQTTAPVGWTKDTTHDNKALRVVSGTAGTGGSASFTAVFAGRNVGDTALTTAQLPSHSHTFNANTGTASANHVHGVSDPGHAHTYSKRFAQGTGSGYPGFDGSGDAHIDANRDTLEAFTNISLTASGADHFHGVSGTTGATGSGSTHSHSIDLAVQYVDLIICSKT